MNQELSFGQRLTAAIRRVGNPVLVGLDPRFEQLPRAIANAALQAESDPCAARATAYANFCRGVIDVVAPLVAAVKPQVAFFEQLGPHGMAALQTVCEYARQKGLLVIIDGKRNDIDSTATAYASGWLRGSQASKNHVSGQHEGIWGGDALTVSPYLGSDSLTPFVNTAHATGSGIFILVKTSNPGGGQFQDLVCEGRPLYRHVADYVEQLAAADAGNARYGSMGAVVGATYPEQLVELRAAMPHAWLLVPGFGSQGGTAAAVMAAFDSEGLGGIINNSRGIIFAHARREYTQFGEARWQDAVEAAAQDMIQQLRQAGYPAPN